MIRHKPGYTAFRDNQRLKYLGLPMQVYLQLGCCIYIQKVFLLLCIYLSGFIYILNNHDNRIEF